MKLKIILFKYSEANSVSTQSTVDCYSLFTLYCTICFFPFFPIPTLKRSRLTRKFFIYTTLDFNKILKTSVNFLLGVLEKYAIKLPIFHCIAANADSNRFPLPLSALQFIQANLIGVTVL